MLQVLENRKDLECENGDSLNASPKTVRQNQKLVRQTQTQFARATRANLRKRSAIDRMVIGKSASTATEILSSAEMFYLNFSLKNP